MAEIDPVALKRAVDNALDRHLEGREYDDTLVANWSKSIRADIVEEIRSYGIANLKLVVTTTILQQGGAGLHTAVSTLWDPEKDLSVTANWESEKIYCHCAAYILRG